MLPAVASHPTLETLRLPHCCLGDDPGGDSALETLLAGLGPKARGDAAGLRVVALWAWNYTSRLLAIIFKTDAQGSDLETIGCFEDVFWCFRCLKAKP